MPLHDGWDDEMGESEYLHGGSTPPKELSSVIPGSLADAERRRHERARRAARRCVRRERRDAHIAALPTLEDVTTVAAAISQASVGAEAAASSDILQLIRAVQAAATAVDRDGAILRLRQAVLRARIQFGSRQRFLWRLLHRHIVRVRFTL